MKDIFATLNYAFEKISENDILKDAGYDSLKRMVSECADAFEAKYGSIDNVDWVKYCLNEIYELYDLIDNALPGLEMGIRAKIEKHLYQNLMNHVRELQKAYKADMIS